MAILVGNRVRSSNGFGLLVLTLVLPALISQSWAGAKTVEELTAKFKNVKESAESPCQTEDASRIGLRACDKIVPQVNDLVRLRTGHVIGNLYMGKVIALDFNDTEPFCVESRNIKTPVCASRKAGEIETDTNILTQKCGVNAKRSDGFCEFDSKNGLKIETCGKELAWFYGLKANALAHALEEVGGEVDRGEIKLVNYSADTAKPTRPCQYYANNYNKLLHDSEESSGYLSAYQKIRLAAKSETALAEEANGCNAAAGAFDISGSDAVLGGLASKGKTAKKPFTIEGSSLSVCHMVMARLHLETLFSNLATCEVMFRAKKNSYSYERFANILGPFRDEVIQPCANYTVTKNDQGKVLDYFYECYSGKVPGKIGAQKFFANLMDSGNFKVNGPVPYKVIMGDKDDYPPNCLKESSAASLPLVQTSPTLLVPHKRVGASR